MDRSRCPSRPASPALAFSRWVTLPGLPELVLALERVLPQGCSAAPALPPAFPASTRDLFFSVGNRTSLSTLKNAPTSSLPTTFPSRGRGVHASTSPTATPAEHSWVRQVWTLTGLHSPLHPTLQRNCSGERQEKESWSELNPSNRFVKSPNASVKSLGNFG